MSTPSPSPSPSGLITPPPNDARRRLAWKLIGWALLLGGLGVLSWLAWAMFATNFGTRAAQEDLLEQWVRRSGSSDFVETPVLSGAATGGVSGGAVGLLTFEREGERILRDEPLVVVRGVTPQDLAKGPGHYPGSALPGQVGNMAVAGHRTTHDAPFANIDVLVPGDHIIVEDDAGAVWTYVVVEQRIVTPSDTSVISSDPLGNGAPMLTLTTCHPRYSNRQRLIVFAQLLTQT